MNKDREERAVEALETIAKAQDRERRLGRFANKIQWWFFLGGATVFLVVVIVLGIMSALR